MRLDDCDVLASGDIDEVLALLHEAADRDGVNPVSEATLIDVRRGSAAPAEGAGVTRHVLARGDDGGLLGYAHLEHAPGQTRGGSGELAVGPEGRRGGVGRALIQHLLDLDPQARIWAHGNTVAGSHLARSAGLESVRDLWFMTLPLTGEWSELPDYEMPEGFEVVPFVPGQDDAAWLEANAAAFVDHAEQGRMTMGDLQDRMAEDWFDPSGFLLVREKATGRIAAFHWTKVEDTSSRATRGEVYVVGVHPDFQGRGLGRPVTLMGLHHLRDRGLNEAVLYVDGDNTRALATYEKLGFERTNVDVMYAAPTAG